MIEPMSLAATALVTALIWQPSMSVDTALWGLERAGSNFESFAANVVFEKHRSFENDTERRFGRIVLDGQGSERRIGCRIDRFIDGGGRSIESKARFIYDDGWFGDVNLADRSFIKRRIVAPGTKVDPLNLGSGPLALPFGQPVEELRARFEVSMASVPQSPLVATVIRPESVCGVRLKPKPGTAYAEKSAFIDVFFDAATLMPRLGNMAEVNGDNSMVILIRPVANEGLSAEDRELLIMPSTDVALWSRVEVKEWEAEQRPPSQPPSDPAPKS